MKILVPIKRVIDAYVKPRVKTDFTGVETQNVKMSTNPFDEIALEEAMRLKEAGKAKEIIVVSVGVLATQEILRTALAIGADRAILVQTEQETQPLTVAKILKLLIAQENPDLVLMGKQAIDDDANQTGQMLAALLDWPQGTYAAKVSVGDDGILVEREIDGGRQMIRLEPPCVITVDLRLNTPRFAKLADIMKARQKKLDIVSLESFDIDLTPRLTLLRVEPPPPRRSGVKVNDVDELIDKLRNEAKVLI